MPKPKNKQNDIDANLIKALLDQAGGQDLFGRDGFFQQLKQSLANGMLEGEIEHHLGYEIQAHLHEIYGTHVSHELISSVTDKVVGEVTAWQNRPLDEIYPIIYLDCIHVKTRDNSMVSNKAVYLAIGINMEG